MSYKRKVICYLALEIFGWYGMIAVLMAYLLASFGTITPTGLSYQILNLTGALSLGIIAYHKRVYQLIALNAIWFFIAIWAISKVLG